MGLFVLYCWLEFRTEEYTFGNKTSILQTWSRDHRAKAEKDICLIFLSPPFHLPYFFHQTRVTKSLFRVPKVHLYKASCINHVLYCILHLPNPLFLLFHVDHCATGQMVSVSYKRTDHNEDLKAVALLETLIRKKHSSTRLDDS